MLLGRMPAAFRPEPPDGREPIEGGFRAIEINKITRWLDSIASGDPIVAGDGGLGDG